MKSKADNFGRKDESKPKTEAEKEKDLVDLFVKIIVEATLKELNEKNKEIGKDKD
jgi:hypothetical protein